MTWNQKYWDIAEQFYWTPKYLGFRSISQRAWIRRDGMVCVPEELVNQTGPLYTRERKFSDLIEHLHESEEVLNHLFDLTFGIAPDQLIRELFLDPLGLNDAGSFESVGREIRKRFGWSESANITQQDAFFVSENTAIGVELKLRSSSWPGQVAKYVALLAWEELLVGSKQQLGLLFIVPQDAVGAHWASCGLEGPTISRAFLQTSFQPQLPTSIQKLFYDHSELVASVLDRMQLAVISWTALRDRLVAIGDQLNPALCGDQTLQRLMKGFVTQLEAYRYTGIAKHV